MMRGRYSVLILALFSWHGCGDSDGNNRPKLCEWIPAESACSYPECEVDRTVIVGQIVVNNGECTSVTESSRDCWRLL